jgi:hypothetical protein
MEQDDFILIQWWYVDNPINPHCRINWNNVVEE